MNVEEKIKKRESRIPIFLLMAVFFALAFFAPNKAKAASPPFSFNYQGKLIINGSLATTTQSMYFVLYDSLTGGNILYTAAGTSLATTSILITPINGLFSVNLGEAGTNVLDPTIFRDNATIYLEVRVGSDILSPRKKITASPYAINSKYLAGYGAATVSSSAYIPVSDNLGNFIFNSTTISTTTITNKLSIISNNTSTFDWGATFAASGGNVGIGTISPAYKLSVAGDINSAGTFRINGTDFGQYFIDSIGTPGQLWVASSTGNRGYWASTSSLGLSGGSSLPSGSDGQTLVNTGGTAWSATNTLFLSTSGNVGIGTTTPSYKLSVAGDINTTGTYRINGVQMVYLPDQASFMGSLVIGNGGLNLEHLSGVEGWVNTFIGINSGLANTIGNSNTALGYGTLSNNNIGALNTAVGEEALNHNTFGWSNDAFGPYALFKNINGSYNLALGGWSLSNNIDGSDNVAVGHSALISMASSTGNVAVGRSAMYDHINGGSNVAIGRSALRVNVNGSGNIAIGFEAGYNEMGSNKLYIDNSATTLPLIYGDFASDTLAVNGKLTVVGTSSLRDTIPETNLIYNLGVSTSRWNNLWANNINIGSSTWSLTVPNNGRLAVSNAPNGTGSEMLSITAGGNVGVGTTSPNYSLSVAGDINSTGAYRINGADYSQFFIDSAGTASYVWQSQGNGRGAWVSTTTLGLQGGGGGGVGGTGSNGHVAFWDGVSTINYDVNNFVWDAANNRLGIGTSSPAYALTVAGDINASGVYRINGIDYSQYFINTAGTSGQMWMSSGTGRGYWVSTSSIGITGLPTGLAGQTLVGAGGTNWNPTSTLFLSSGNVGIGTTTPATKLSVVGNISNLIGANSGVREIATISVGSVPWSIYISGRYAYTANAGASTISVIDISNPSAPIQIATTSVGAQPYSIYVSGRYAYTANGEASTISVIDISNPSAPIQIATTSVGASPESIYVSGRYAYTANRVASTISVVDISNPSAPIQIATTSVVGSPISIFASGRYAYTANGDSTISVIDISNPSAPIQIATAAVGSTPNSIYVSGRYAYVANIGNDTISVIDISNPSAPIQIATAAVGLSPNSIFVSGRYAYTANQGADTISVIDITGTEVSSLMAGSLESGNIQSKNDIIAQGIINAGTSLSVGSGGIISNGSIAITATNSPNYFGGKIGIGTTSPNYSLSVVGDINATGTYRINGTDYGQYFIDSVGTVGQLWMSTGTGRGYWASTSSLGITGGSSLPSGSAGQTLVNAGGTTWNATNSLFISASGSVGIGTTTPSTKLSVVGNISNLIDANSGVRQIATTSVGSSPQSIYVSGRYAYTANYWSSTISIVDISNPSAPIQIATTSVGTYGSGMYGPASIYVSGRYAYTANPNYNTISVIDISNPSAPIQIATTSVGTYPHSIYVSGRYAYTANQSGNTISVIDISNPSAPIQIATAAVVGGPYSIYVSGRYAYTANSGNNSTISVIDISNPSAPIQIATTSVGANPESIYVSGRYAYVANDTDNTISVVDISNPSAPIQIATTSVGAYPTSVYVSGRYAYVTNAGDSTISVVDITGTEVASLMAGSLESGNIQSKNDIIAQGIINAGTSLYVGSGGIISNGAIAITATNTPNYFGGKIGIGTTSPIYSLSVVGDINATGTYRINGTDYGQYFIDSAGTVGYLWQSLGSGRGQWVSTSSLAIANLYSGWSLSTSSADTGYNIASGTKAIFTGINGVTTTRTNNILTIGLTTTTVTANTYGSAAAVPVFTVDSYGRITNAVSTTISIDASQISSGILSIIRGGTNSSTIASNGSVIYSNGTNYTGTAVGTAGQLLQSNAAGAPTWVSTSALGIVGLPTGTTGQTLVNNGGTNWAPTSTLFVSSTGNVGIGTTTPLYKLSVVGDINATGTYRINGTDYGQYFIDSVGIAGQLWVASSTGNRGYWASTSSLGLSASGLPTGSAGQTLVNSGGTNWSPTNTLFLSTVGNIGIGTTTPNTKLSVVGNISNLIDANSGVREIATTSVGTSPGGIFVSGRYAYVTNVGDQTISVVDISNPITPVQIATASLYIHYKAADDGFPSSIYVSGRYAYVTISAEDGSSAISVVDISNPSAPVQVATTSVTNAGSANPTSIYIVGKYAYTANYGDGTMSIVDISNPFAPARISTTTVGINPYSIYVSGRYAYVTAFNDSNVIIVDVANPLYPSQVGTVSLDGTPSGIYVSGRYAYVTKSSNNGLSIIDISKPSTAFEAGTVTVGNIPMSVYVAGRYAYVANSGDGSISVVDVSNPSVPVQITTALTGTTPLSVYASGHYAYVANSGDNTISVIDITGTEVSSLMAGSLESGNIQSRNDVIAQGIINAGTSLSVGAGGIISNGSLSITATNTPNYFGGKVGIGTSSPAYSLSVVGDINATGTYRINGTDYGQYFIDSAGTPGYVWMASSTGSRGYWASTSSLGLSASGLPTGSAGQTLVNAGDTNWSPTNTLFLSTSGNVGIGTTTPAYKLSIQSGAAGTKALAIYGGGAGPATLGFNAGWNYEFDLPNATYYYHRVGGNVEMIISNLGIITVDGTNGGYSFIGDEDTKMYRSAANTLSFLTNGAEIVRMTSTSVGIGTTTPLYSLSVVGDINATGTYRINGTDYGQYFIDSTGTPGYVWMASSTGNRGYWASTSSLGLSGGSSLPSGSDGQTLVNTGGTAWSATNTLFLSTSGNVGIGTTTPSYKLSVAGDINTTGTYRMNGVDYGQYFIDSAGTASYIWQSQGNGRGAWVSTSTLGLQGGGGGIAGSGSNGHVAFWDGVGSVTYDLNSFVWDAANNRLGIGAPTPLYSLSVVGDINATGTYRINGTDYGQYFIDSAGTTGYLWQSLGSGRGQWVSTSSLSIPGLSYGWSLSTSSDDVGYNIASGTKAIFTGINGVTTTRTNNTLSMGLTTTTVTANTYGSAAAVPVFTVDAYGRITNAVSTTISIDVSQLSSGILSIVRGGTNSSTIASNGSVIYSNGTYYTGTAVGSAGQLLQSNAAGAPTWVSTSALGIVGLPTGTTGQTLVNNGGTNWTPTSTLFVSSTGNIGIGTTTPLYKLSVVGDINATGTYRINGTDYGQYFIDSAGTVGQIWMASSTGNRGYWANTSSLGITGLPAGSAGQTLVNAGGTNWSPTNSLFISTSGKVGIGTTTPLSLLTVQGIDNATSSYAMSMYNVSSSLLFRVGNDGSMVVNDGAISHDASTQITYINSIETGGLSFPDDAGQVSWANLMSSSSPAGTPLSYTASIGDIPMITVYGESDGSAGIKSTSTMLGFGTTTPQFAFDFWGPTSSVNLFRIATSTNNGILNILSNGNIGINTTSPIYKLSVVGDINATGTYRINGVDYGQYFIDSVGIAGQLWVASSTGNRGYWASTSSLGLSGAGLPTGSAGQTLVNAGGTNWSPTNTLFLSTTGNVGIGTTTPTTKLSVSGNISNLIDANSGVREIATTSVGDGSANPYSLFVSGKYVYTLSEQAGDGRGYVTIHDVSNPYTPSKVGEAPFLSTSNMPEPHPPSIFISGHYAYVGSDTGTITIFDVSNVSTPAGIEKTIPIYPNSVYVSGKYAYLGSNDNYSPAPGFVILDVSNPRAPTQVFYSSGYTIDSIYVLGKYAYITEGSANQIRILDISNPSNPVVVGTLSLGAGTNPQSISVSGRYAYVANYDSNNISVVDISNPAVPVQVATTSVGTNPKSISISGRYAYVANYGSNNVSIVDISNASLPVQVATTSVGTNPISISVSGRYAYVANYGSFNMSIIDITGTEVSSLMAGSLESGNIQSRNNIAAQGIISAGTSLSVGIGGIVSNGSISITATNTPSYFGGKIGIGTTTPLYSLSVVGDINATGTYRINGTDYGQYFIDSTGTPGYVWMASSTGNRGYWASTSSLGLSVVGLPTGSAGQTLVNSGGTNWSPTNTLFLSTTGNIGIGTTTPNTKLSVVGNISNLIDANSGVREIATTSVGANPHSIYVSGRYAYTANYGANTISVIDISNPSAPIQIATTSVGSGPQNIFVSGRFAYVANSNDNTISVIDISNPSAPIQIATTSVGEGSNSIYISGKYAYVGVGGVNAYISVIDISNPFAPIQIATTSVGGGGIWSVYVSGRYAYVTQYSNSSISVIDISNPSAPIKIATTSVEASPVSIYVSGRYAYTANQSNSISVIDISNPFAPIQIATTSVGGTPQSIFVSGRYAYVANWTNNTISVIDISIPSAPRQVVVTQVGLAPSSPNSIFVSGHYAYTANEGNSNISVVDITGTEVSSLMAGSLEAGNIQSRNDIIAQGIISAGTSLSVGIGGIISNGAIAITATNTASYFGGSVGIGVTTTPTTKLSVSGNISNLIDANSGIRQIATTSVGSFTSSIFVSGRYAYTANSSNTISVIDISNPSAPIQIATTSVGTAPSGIYVSGHYAYTSNYTSNDMSVIDVSNPSKPIQVATTSVGLNPTDIFVSGKYAYVSNDASYSMSVVDISNPLAPKQIVAASTGSSDDSPASIYIAGRYAYMPTGAGSLIIFDISNPTAPVLLPRATASGYPTGIYVSGRYLYSPTQGDGVDKFEVIDISNPSSTVIIASTSIGVGSVPTDVFVSGRYAYTTHYASSSISVVDVASPYFPKKVVTIPVEGHPYSIYVSGHYAYVTNDTGIIVIDITGTEVSSLMAGSLESGNIQSRNDIIAQGMINAGTSLFVGVGGIMSNGALAITATNTPSYFNGKVGIGSTTPTYLLSMAGGGYYSTSDNQWHNGSSRSIKQDIAPITEDQRQGLLDMLDTLGINQYRFINDVAENGTSSIWQYGFIAEDTPQLLSGRDQNSMAIGSAVNFSITNIQSLYRMLKTASSSLSALNTVISVNTSTKNVYLGYNPNTPNSDNYNVILSGSSFDFINTSSIFTKLSFQTSTVFESNIGNYSSAASFILNSLNFTTSSDQSDRYILSLRSNNNSVFSVSGNGDVRAAGSYYGSSIVLGTSTNPGDMAEKVDIAIDDNVEAGDVVMVDPNNTDTYRRTNSSYEQSVAGIISSNPTIIVGNGKTNYTANMAMVGRVPVKVSIENGNIKRGDLLISSGKQGYAMRYDAQKDTQQSKFVGVIGVALESADADTKIMALIRTGWIYNRDQTIAQAQSNINQLAAEAGVDLAFKNEPNQLQVVESPQNQILYSGSGALNLNNNVITNVSAIFATNNIWKIDEEGNVVQKIATASGEKETFGLQSMQKREIVISGTSTLENGSKIVVLKDLDQSIIDKTVPLKIMITPAGETKGVYVSERGWDGFVVKENGGGTSNATFDWTVIAKILSNEEIQQQSVSSTIPSSAPPVSDTSAPSSTATLPQTTSTSPVVLETTTSTPAVDNNPIEPVPVAEPVAATP